MKTLFAFMTGILGGIMIGGAVMYEQIVNDKNLRVYVNNVAETLESAHKEKSQK